MWETMTLKERRWLDAYLETGNATEAARRAGYSSSSEEALRTAGSRNLKKMTLSINETLDRMGLTEVALVKRLQAGLEATAVVTAKWEGKITDEREYPDWAARLGYLDMAFRLRGMYPSDKAAQAVPEGLNLLRQALGVKESD